MMLEEEVEHLRAENAALREQLAAALARIAELEQQRPDPSFFVQPNQSAPPDPQRPRKKRCPDCNYRLHGTSIDYHRQEIELLLPSRSKWSSIRSSSTGVPSASAGAACSWT